MRNSNAEKRMTIDADQPTYFHERMNTLPGDSPLGLGFNMNETGWRLYEAPRRVLEEKEKNTVKLRSHKNEKTLFIAFGGIACTGDKLSLWMIAKGKATPNEGKFGSDPRITIKYAKGGWATESPVVEYFQ
jgi:hypothetical protein